MRMALDVMDITAPTMWHSMRRYSRARVARPRRAVQWMREDGVCVGTLWPGDDGEDQCGARCGSAISLTGNMDVQSYPHSTRPEGKDGGESASPPGISAEPKPAATPANPPLPPGGSHRNAIPLYDFPNQRVSNHLVTQSPLRVSALRALGAHANVFVIESSGGRTRAGCRRRRGRIPLASLGKDPRARAVIEAVAQKSGWKSGAVRR